jgi:hypothetical protein
MTRNQAMQTLQRLEASRNINPTRFYPESLSNYKIQRYVPNKQFAKNKLLKTELFEQIIKVTEYGNTVQAIGYDKEFKPTILILEKQ